MKRFGFDRVLFVSAKAASHQKTSTYSFSNVQVGRFCQKSFASAPPLAVLHDTGTPSHLLERCLRIVRDESLILTISQLAYARRSNIGHVGLFGEVTSQGVDYLFLNRQDKTFTGGGFLTKGHQGLKADERWKEWQKKSSLLTFENSPQDNSR